MVTSSRIRLIILFAALCAFTAFACDSVPSISNDKDLRGLPASHAGTGGSTNTQPTVSIDSAGAGEHGPVIDISISNAGAPPATGQGGASDVSASSAGAFSAGAGGEGGYAGAYTEKECEPTLVGTLRDFVQGNMPKDKIPAGITPHPDFEEPWENAVRDTDIVTDLLGSDGKPVYAHPDGTTISTHGADWFNKWYNDDATVNMSLPVELQLHEDPNRPGTFVYDNGAFYPLDGNKDSFGESWNLWDPNNYLQAAAPGDVRLAGHNYHMTMELVTSFRYQGGEHFTFSGDDDVWVYINNHRVIELGGAHTTLSQDVKLDDVANDIGLEVGKDYTLNFFWAERHLTESNFHVETSMAFCKQKLPPPPHHHNPPPPDDEPDAGEPPPPPPPPPPVVIVR